MMKSFRHFRNTWLQLHFLLLFVVYYAGSNFFSHTHSIDGEVVAHSHPFAGSGGHHHTSVECSIISLVTHFTATESALPVSISMFLILIASFGICYVLDKVSFYFNHSHFLRPPPSLQPVI